VLFSPAGSGLGGYDDALAKLPRVAAIAPLAGLNALPAGTRRRMPGRAAVSKDTSVRSWQEAMSFVVDDHGYRAGARRMAAALAAGRGNGLIAHCPKVSGVPGIDVRFSERW
jgi:hypothetical protein